MCRGSFFGHFASELLRLTVMMGTTSGDGRLHIYIPPLALTRDGKIENARQGAKRCLGLGEVTLVSMIYYL